jgi:hypothetical protein
MGSLLTTSRVLRPITILSPFGANISDQQQLSFWTSCMDGDSNLREDSISGYRIYYYTKTSVLEDTLSRSPRVLRIGATVIEVLPLSAGPMGSRSARSPSPHLGSK